MSIRKKAFISSIPVMAGYIVLGIGFGIVLKSAGYGLIWALAMSLFIYAGSMQYAMIGLITGGASFITVGLTTLMVNARHLFYGISMVDKYENMGVKKPYLVFALTDETYSLVCDPPKDINKEDLGKYYFLVSLFDQCYWVTGSILGSLLGEIIPFSTEGVDFALTALFITIFTDQWLNNKNHIPAIIGLVATTVCLVIFGSSNFLIPSMILIMILLFTMKKFSIKEESDNE